MNTIIALQIVRAIAVISVLWLHTFTSPNIGKFGVDIFFVLSGFIMPMLVEIKRQSGISFMLARLSRIIPLYWLITTLVFVTAFIAPHLMNTTQADPSHLIKSLLFIPHSRDNGSLYPMLMPGWTLNYEMFFYFIIFFSTSAKGIFAYVAIMILILSYMASSLLADGSVAYKFLHTSLWFEFVVGMLCYKIWSSYREKTPNNALHVALIIVLILFMAAYENKYDRLITAGIPSGILILCILQLETAIKKSNTWLLRAFIHIGDSSYSTYLTHLFSIGVVERVILKNLNINKGHVTAILTVLFALMIGSVVHYIVDGPLVRWIRRLYISGLVPRS